MGSITHTYDEMVMSEPRAKRWAQCHVDLLNILHNPMKAGRRYGPDGVMDVEMSSFLQLLKILLPGWEEDQIRQSWNDLYDEKLHRTKELSATRIKVGIRGLENRLTPYGRIVAEFLSRQKS